MVIKNHSENQHVVPWNSTDSSYLNSEILGGKGLNLMLLIKHGFHVPPFWIIRADSLFELFKETDVPSLDFLDSWIFEEHSATHFSVRSSAIREDSSNFSFAGQFCTMLNVPVADLKSAVIQVWKSLNSPSIRSYCEEHQLELPDRMAIVIQEMITSEVSGVAFGINPVNGRRDEVVISSVFGLGEGLVSGELDADTYRVNEQNTEVKISPKTKKLIRAQNGSTNWVQVEEELQNTSSLSELQVQQICEVLKQLRKVYKRPQDIEFAVENGELFLLQTRPVTAINQVADPLGEMILWDNSNIIESYPGVTTPLTFSFIVKMYASVYVQLCRLLGVSKSDLEDNAVIFENMLGLIRGRVYYNLLSWYKALALLPGYHLNAEFMEKMMGVKERFELKNLPQRTKWTERFRVLIMLRSMWKNLRQLPRMRIDFQREFQGVMDEYNSIDLSSKSAHELMELYLKFEKTLLKKWKAPLVNDFYAMIYFGVLQKLVDKYQLPSGIHNDLLSGAEDIISTQPIKRMEIMRDAVLEDTALTDLFHEKSAEELMDLIAVFNPQLQNLFWDYLHNFGDRCVGELKLETITYKQDPIMLMQLLQMYVKQGKLEYKSLNLREVAEKKVNERLRGYPLRRRLFQFVLNRTRILVSARENLRFERTRGFGKVREIFLCLGDVFYSEGIILEPRDIFYLTQNEVFDFIKGTSVTPEISELIEFRKSKYKEYERSQTAERIRTHGMVYHGNVFASALKFNIMEGDLQGVGCCPGVVKAQVQVVNDPKEVVDLRGDILVTASTDPGWVTLFPNASGILVERGSLLSHSAIVSRELGKPCVVGITGLLSCLKTGDWVEMDGSTGCVKVLKEGREITQN